MAVKNYNKNIFINCPFDEHYLDIFYAQVFCVFDCGFMARCALEDVNSGEVRIDKIFMIISQCKFGIHDISRTELCKKTKLPRFNMPLELGMFLGAKKYGNGQQKNKTCLITDKAQYRYQTFISDIAGLDIKSHNDDPYKAISLVSAWLRNSTKRKNIPGGAEIVKRYKNFRTALPVLCKNSKITQKEMTFNDYSQLVSAWLLIDKQKQLEMKK